MSVKIEVLRRVDFGSSTWPRPWSVSGPDSDGEWTVDDSSGNSIGWWSDEAEARAIVDAVNAIPSRKGKIEKFVVEMDPETFRRLWAVLANLSGGDPTNTGEGGIYAQGLRFCASSPGINIGEGTEVFHAIERTTLKEDA